MIENKLLKYILANTNNKKQLAVLIDPDKQDLIRLKEIVKKIDDKKIDLILVGGSLITDSIYDTISTIKKHTNIPVIIFPGSYFHISKNADAILLLSLISGRNPELLIGNHVISAHELKKSKLEIIPTGYMLIENGNITSVEYISNTKPIPANKPDIAVSTAMAGEMLGLKLIYMDAGSGAKHPINPLMISKVKQNINIPLIIGGGINTKQKLKDAYTAGADLVVIGTAFEQNINLLDEFIEIRDK